MKAGNKTLGPRLRVVLDTNIAIGPGQADLLEAIGETGSISQAGRSMGMSYRRAWLLVQKMNGHFSGPLVQTAKGGNSGGGAQLTPLGREVVACYRQMEARASDILRPEIERLRDLLANDLPQDG
ncbi:winged helix-turn-helix domain-containing protein [Nisaea acidiphila]|uniref:Winged helix-turn-helix domain-containing protein n=1 Tax=Nisaea acidiphila TaxID=1862145 RepID=A0A9J7AVE4_9PROT|nr:winged helix-turn-helix domain-containing protein [Nisaea acidiphila]UUX51086.1 winged helix-turn-helix domain-containing protein [Nisaea acidiphila]